MLVLGSTQQCVSLSQVPKRWYSNFHHIRMAVLFPWVHRLAGLTANVWKAASSKFISLLTCAHEATDSDVYCVSRILETNSC